MNGRIRSVEKRVLGLVRGDNVRPGVGYRKVATVDGYILKPYGGRASANTARYPFDISVAGTTVTFRAGTINGFLPTNYLTGVTTVATGTRYLVLNCTASNGQITAATFSVDSSQPGAIAPYQGQPPTSFKILIGLTIDGKAFKIWGNGNIQADPVEAFRIDKVSPPAGTLPYVIYYTWSLRLT